MFATNAMRYDELEKEKKKTKSAQKEKRMTRQEERPSLLGQLRINQQIIAEQEAIRPSRRTCITTLQKSAQTVAYLQENGYQSLGELKAACYQAKQRTAASKKKLDAASTAITRLNEQLHYTGRYYTHKKTYQDFLHAKNKGRFRSEHNVAISEYESARDWLQSHAKDGTLPSYEYVDTPIGKFPGTAKVRDARDWQVEKKKEYRAEYNAARQKERELRAIRDSVDTLINAPALNEQARARRRTDQSL